MSSVAIRAVAASYSIEVVMRLVGCLSSVGRTTSTAHNASVFATEAKVYNEALR